MAVTITISDGSETRVISLSDDKEIKLNDALDNMGAKKYRLENKITPRSVSGLTRIQQLRQLIIESIKGVYFKVQKDSIQTEAEAEKDNLSY